MSVEKQFMNSEYACSDNGAFSMITKKQAQQIMTGHNLSDDNDYRSINYDFLHW